MARVGGGGRPHGCVMLFQNPKSYVWLGDSAAAAFRPYRNTTGRMCFLKNVIRGTAHAGGRGLAWTVTPWGRSPLPTGRAEAVARGQAEGSWALSSCKLTTAPSPPHAAARPAQDSRLVPAARPTGSGGPAPSWGDASTSPLARRRCHAHGSADCVTSRLETARGVPTRTLLKP